VVDVPVEAEELPVVAAPGEPDFDWSNFWPTLLHETNKKLKLTIARILFMFQLTLGELEKQAASTRNPPASQDEKQKAVGSRQRVLGG
jgi:hypothetical protein